MTISGAIVRLQELIVSAAAASNYVIRSAPDNPIQDAGALPLSLAYISAANGGAEDATWNLTRYTITMQVHFNATSLKNVYSQVNAIVPGFIRRISGDPKLSGNVDTIIFPVDCTIGTSNFDGVPTIAAEFAITVKVIDTHAST